jgi:beta-glucosidase
MHHIDARAREVLKLVRRAKQSGIPFDAKESLVDNDETRALLRKASANSVVLLKNEKSVLPIKSAKKIAVIGSNARVAVASGGGSASMLSSYTVTPLEGITSAAKELGAEVDYAIGSASYMYLPAATNLLSHPDGKRDKEVAQMDFWLQEPSSDFTTAEKASVKISTKPDYSVGANTANAFMMDGIPRNIGASKPFIRYRANFSPDQDGDWQFALGSVGSANLYVNGKHVVDNDSKWEAGEMWFNMGSKQRIGIVKDLKMGQQYSVEVRCWHRESALASPFQTAGAIRIGALPVVEDAQAIADAVKIAQQADTTIVVVGLNEDWESEGYDRKHME